MYWVFQKNWYQLRCIECFRKNIFFNSMSRNNSKFYAWCLNAFSFPMNDISIGEKKIHKILNTEFWVVSTHPVKTWKKIGLVIKLQNDINFFETPCIEEWKMPYPFQNFWDHSSLSLSLQIPLWVKLASVLGDQQLHIGHTKQTHSFILKREQLWKCSYGTPYTVKHILMECKNLTYTQRKFCNIKSMWELFETKDPNNIINLKKEKINTTASN